MKGGHWPYALTDNFGCLGSLRRKRPPRTCLSTMIISLLKHIGLAEKRELYKQSEGNKKRNEANWMAEKIKTVDGIEEVTYGRMHNRASQPQ